MDIEPDGQQFLNARTDESPTLGPPSPAPPPSGSSRSIVVPVVAVLVAIVLIGGAIAFFALGGSGGVADLTGLEASGEGAEVGERKEDPTTTTTEATRETTTTAAPTTTSTTAAPLDGFPAGGDTGQPGGAIEPPVIASCPGGAVDASAIPEEVKRTAPGSNTWIVKAKGTAVNRFPTSLTLNLQLLVNSSGGVVPLNVTISPNPVGGGATTNWTYSGTLDSAADVTISGITGSFTFSDPAYAHCQSGTVG